MNKHNLSFVKGALFTFAISTAFGYAFAAWTPPTSAPPGNNTQPPVNVGTALQEKKGSLIVGTAGASNYFFSPNAMFTRIAVGKTLGSDMSIGADIIGRIVTNSNITASGSISGSSLSANSAAINGAITASGSITGNSLASNSAVINGAITASGKIKSALTVAGDTADTVVTKSYVDSNSGKIMQSYEVIETPGNGVNYTVNHTGLVEIIFSGCTHQAGLGGIGWSYKVNGAQVNGVGPWLVDFQVGWCPTYTYFMNATGNFTVNAWYTPGPFGHQIVIKKYN